MHTFLLAPADGLWLRLVGGPSSLLQSRICRTEDRNRGWCSCFWGWQDAERARAPLPWLNRPKKVYTSISNNVSQHQRSHRFLWTKADMFFLGRTPNCLIPRLPHASGVKTPYIYWQIPLICYQVVISKFLAGSLNGFYDLLLKQY